MNPERLLQHFDTISEAPDAVAKLRKLILDLAVRGKLVEQDTGDEPASKLLQRIALAPSVARGKASHGKVAASRANPSIELPICWVWTTLGDLARYGNSENVNSNCELASSDWVLDLEDIEKQTGRLVERVDAGARPFQSAKTRFAAGDVLFGKLRPYLCKVIVATEPGVCTTEIVPITTARRVASRFLQLVLRSPLTMDRVGQLMYGMKMPRLGTADASALAFPLPPSAEQNRIVAKVDELMALCDQLQAARDAREQQRDQLVTASLQRLTPSTSDDAHESIEAIARRAEPTRLQLHHFQRLTTRVAHIKQLRQTIFSLAVRGRLVPQVPEEEAGNLLLKRINEAFKARGKKGGKLERSTAGSGIPSAFGDMPRGWCGAKVGELIQHSDAGWSPKTESFARSGDAWGVLKVSAVSWEKFKPEENKQLLPGVSPPAAAVVRKGDFLISRANTSELVAKCVVVGEPPENLILSDKIVRLYLTELCSKRFLQIVNNKADFSREHYARFATGVSPSMKNVSRSVIYDLFVPIPPLAEQHRIVAKVDALMVLCDELEASLASAQADRTKLLNALLHEALASAVDHTDHVGVGRPDIHASGTAALH